MAEAPLHWQPEFHRLEPHLPPVPPVDLSPPSSSSSASSSSPPPLPPSAPPSNPPLPFTTLTFATSLDSALALGPGIPTALSGPQSKAMTHYLRSRHDAICVGVGTAIADDPGLNSRIIMVPSPPPPPPPPPHGGGPSVASSGGSGDRGSGSNSVATIRQPRPVVIDPRLRWDFTADSRVLRLAREGRGLAPYVVTLEAEAPAGRRRLLEDAGGKFIVLGPARGSPPARLAWPDILAALRREGLRSVMVEGGADVVNSLLGEHPGLVDSVVVTIAPTWLGRGGVVVCPPRTRGPGRPAARLRDVAWIPLGEDVVLCGKMAP
ncbi:putative 5-amino-6-(5-phosphoribosylamino) uracil reductase [Rosellinia necatrix]|uniref:2,5-diamino-6-ribosylamino-4(3H)-pyrimidinone 5'-phosphate reductase n=1 Tax=Rosellinia necatrix TaxID=77044 RepID=A0A1S8A4L6_ROSNE|nr:putative 5-amino-6-(5-phosphoribosylamino) uracil reductase [Rosellinia necatrix]